MTHPQFPASPPPEAAEPVAWQHLKAYGYAPGNYMNKCHTCGKVVEFVDKRAITCRPCAETRHAAAPSPVAQAPAQAGEVAGVVRKAFKVEPGSREHFWLLMAPYHLQWVAGKDAEHLLSFAADVWRAALATPPAQPVLTPVVREPLTEERIVEMSRRLTGTQYESLVGEQRIKFARLIERAHGIQATTGEQSHGD